MISIRDGFKVTLWRPLGGDGVRAGILTADWTTEQRMSNMERVTVDSGTHAGIHVPVGDF